ncbi:hypothetical protein K4L06_03075 [Lysobacter sp. BMK333-48F3]|uniref:XVIPCD domain-containing protein n=1 Tax=Lysobacter sp. BMK333-48F3 TaxID=2867962 RepID=UPI001C8CEA1A|nr:XVIPCD domain-containing protein [Lysobacter sp. BMK333-48F3]MBX9400277.1 hypothetical protein [Lysobacter sp. BMK333-48F3]
MSDESDRYVYNPLERATFEAIAYNAIGRGSEINTLPAYRLSHSSAGSGWSVGLMQWDFGQPGRREKVPELLAGYQQWARGDAFTAAEVASLTTRLQTSGQGGNALSRDEQNRLNEYLRSDPGREFVNGLDREQIAYKWDNVGQPLSQIPWLQELSRNDPSEAAEIVAMASKRFNQGEVRGRELISHLRQNETTSQQLSDWIGTHSARAPADRDSIVSGRDAALSAVQLMNSLELGSGPLSRAWREQVHTQGNVGLTQGFSFRNDSQLLDAMMRAPASGRRIFAQFDEGAPYVPVMIDGANELARLEMASVRVGRDGVLTMSSTRDVDYLLTAEGWELAHPQPERRAPDTLDHLEPRVLPQGPPGRGANASDVGSEALPVVGADHRVIKTIRDRLPGAFAQHGPVPPPQDLDRIAACLAVECARNGLGRPDHIVVGHPAVDGSGRHVFAVEGEPGSPAHLRADVAGQQAAITPVSESMQRLEAMQAQRDREQSLAQAQQAQDSQRIATPRV